MTTYRLVRTIDSRLETDSPSFRGVVTRWANGLTARLLADDVMPAKDWCFHVVDEHHGFDSYGEPIFVTKVIIDMEGARVDQEANNS